MPSNFFYQACSIDISVDTFDTATVNLVYDRLNMSQKLDMAIFHIVDWKFENKVFKVQLGENF